LHKLIWVILIMQVNLGKHIWAFDHYVGENTISARFCPCYTLEDIPLYILHSNYLTMLHTSSFLMILFVPTIKDIIIPQKPTNQGFFPPKLCDVAKLIMIIQK
jgi:hypothetical protein